MGIGLAGAGTVDDGCPVTGLCTVCTAAATADAALAGLGDDVPLLFLRATVAFAFAEFGEFTGTFGCTGFLGVGAAGGFGGAALNCCCLAAMLAL
jgi:hypothetical protein